MKVLAESVPSLESLAQVQVKHPISSQTIKYMKLKKTISLLLNLIKRVRLKTVKQNSKETILNNLKDNLENNYETRAFDVNF